MDITRLTDVNHTTTATLLVPPATGDGPAQEERLTVVYGRIDAAVLKQLDEIDKDDERGSPHKCALLVKALPDLTQGGVPVPVSLELFLSMDARHPARIIQAITEDFFRAPSAAKPEGNGGD